MSDRTWNRIEAALYEEEWSQAARIIAGVVLAKCPNQYGIFKFPWQFLKDLFAGIYSRTDIAGVIAEWEADGWVKLYDDQKIIWIKKKWQKEQPNRSTKHWQGLATFLNDYPMVIKDFMDCYNPHAIPIQSPCHPPVNSDTDTETEKKKETNLASKSDADIKNASLPPGNGKPSKPHIPIEERKANTPISRLVQQWFRHYLKYEQIRWSGDPAAMSGQAKILLKSHDYPTLIMAMGHLFDKPHEKYRPHEWNFYVRKISTLILEAQDAGCFPDPQLKLERTNHA